MDYCEQILDELKSMSTEEAACREYYYSAKTLSDCQKLLNHLGLANAMSMPLCEKDVLQYIHAHIQTDEHISAKLGSRKLYLEQYPRYLPIRPHKHEYCILCYVAKGSCLHRLEDTVLLMTEGMFCFIAPNVRHCIEADDDTSIVINIYIPEKEFYPMFMNQLHQPNPVSRFFAEILFTDNRQVNYLLFDTSKDTFLRNQILSMLQEQKLQDNYSSAMLLHMLNIFFLHLLRNYTELVTQKKQACIDNTALNMLFYIHKHLQTVSLPDLAKYYGYSETHCSRILKKATGYGYAELLRKIRMKQAQTLLENSALSIARIGEMVGYENTENFIRTFKKEFQITPTAYRSRYNSVNPM